MSRFKTAAFGCLLVLGAAAARGQAVGGILNYVEYSDRFASAGQPSEAELEALRDSGFERIIYIAFSNDGDALPNEDRIVRRLGMDYVHIPVIWDAPTVADFESFAAVMQRDPGQKTLLHCQVNMRATAFSFLYRVLYEGVSVAAAKADMNRIWEPNATWRELIFEVLEANGVSPDCPGCDWGG